MSNEPTTPQNYIRPRGGLKNAASQVADDTPLFDQRPDTTSPITAQPAPAAAPKPPPLWTVAAIKDGYPITVQFAGKVEDLEATITRLRQIGATPPAQPAQQWAYTPDGLPICPKHGAPMKKREKQGDCWHSHVVTAPDGEDLYCRGYHGKDSPGYEC
jgi:hypothetical protein